MDKGFNMNNNLDQIKENLEKSYSLLDHVEIKGKENNYYMFYIISMIKGALELLTEEIENSKKEQIE